MVLKLIVATMVEKKMIPLITQMEMNLQKRTIQVAKKMIITLNLTAMAQTNQVTQVARMTLPETESFVIILESELRGSNQSLINK
jgi:hypothetical protein